ncbi:RES family NAD+ phosphorylase [Paenibacillus popilliae]|uniref:RES domain-containing protein n=1 Tax=Paenibacillus popilliae TaxID=78057 RepID=A0ABY3AU83_PAEPP|nr:RES family NAD+ phosphorylase [Paenibacillus sp. SDF0028]TQR46382.1 RES domain-containing protein [Paenibacillus sp. SDF0028]
MEMNLAKYQDDTRKFFGKLIRDVFGSEPCSKIIVNEDLDQKLTDLSDKIRETPELVDYTWWWRGISNDSLSSFEYKDGYLYMDGDRLRIKELFVQVSPIPRFDFILLNIEGEEKKNALTEDYAWRGGEYKLDEDINLETDTIYSNSALGQLNEDSFYYRLPYNKIMTAKFGAPNNNFFSDNKLEIMLNKLLFGVITYNEFTEWYNTPLYHLKKKIDDLHLHLITSPMLGLDHDVGRSILKHIGKMPKINIENKIYYRARELKSMSPYTESEMWNPPVGRVPIGEGRYNHFAQSYLYMADNEETVFKEVIPPWHKTCSMARFKVIKCSNVLDLRRVTYYNDDSESLLFSLIHYMLVFEGAVSKPVENEFIKSEYLIPRFLADAARRNRFNGILFNSTKNPNGENLVLFDPESLRSLGWVKMQAEPYLYSI